MNGPWGLVVDKNGTVVLSDPSHERIQIFSSEGNFLKTLDCNGIRGEPLYYGYPRGVTISPDGEILVADEKRRRIHIFG